MNIRKFINPAKAVLFFLAVIFCTKLYYDFKLTAFIEMNLIIFLFCFIFIRWKNMDVDNSNDDKIAVIILTAAAAIFMSVRLYKITSVPCDFSGDEWTNIYEAYKNLAGQRHFFDYNSRNSAALPYVSISVLTAAIAIFRENLDMLRIIPFLAFVFTGCLLFYLGVIIKSKRTGALWFFLYSTSGWALLISKELFYNIYVPLFAVLLLVLFYLYIIHKKVIYIFLAGIVFFLGFYTFSSWLLMAILLVYMIIEYRDKLGKKVFILLISGILAVTFFAVLTYSLQPNIFEYVNKQTGGGSAGYLKMLLDMPVHLYKFFVLPISEFKDFAQMPMMCFTEYVLLVLGLIAVFENINNKENRVLLAGLLISSITFFIENNTGSHMRHILFLPFAVMISGACIEKIMDKKYLYQMLAINAFFFICFISVYYVVWQNNEISNNSVYRVIANYINGLNNNTKYLYLYDSEVYGNYSVFLRVKTGNKMGNFNGVVFLRSYMQRKQIRAIFPGTKIKYFLNNGDINALYQFEFNNDGILRNYFMTLSRKLEILDNELWEQNFEKEAESAKSQIIKSGKPLDKFSNSIIMSKVLEGYNRIGKIDEIENILIKDKQYIINSGNYFYLLGNIFENKRNYKKAEEYYREAEKISPEWMLPRLKLKIFNEKKL